MRLAAISLLVMLVTLPGCISVSHHGATHRGHGPPPHAPAHGHRHHHGGAQLVFDAKLGVYVVLGHSDLYFWDGRFLRLHGVSWEASARLSGPWRPYASRSLPPGLSRAHPTKAKRIKRKGQAPAKGHW